MLTAERLRQVLDYNPETGSFTWKERTSRRVRVGSVAGYKRTDGYIDIRLDGALLGAHRLAFVWMTGCELPCWVDHINGVRDDNRWANIRLCDQQQNQQNKAAQKNNQSGFRGVHFDVRRQRWMAFATINKRRRHIGYFDTKEEAAVARDEYVIDRAGEFACLANGINVHGHDMRKLARVA